MNYPDLFRRYIASVIDVVTVIGIMYLYAKTPLYTAGESAGAIAFLVVWVVYEPLATVFACTLGQAVMRFRVRRASNLARISLGQALLRMLVKYLLGMVSFLTLPARRDRRSIHDLAAGTIVVEARFARNEEKPRQAV